MSTTTNDEIRDTATAAVTEAARIASQAARRGTETAKESIEVARSYFYLATRLPFLVMSARRRNMWLVAAAAQLGRVWGSVEHRVFAP